MFDFELSGKRENIEERDCFVMRMKKEDKIKHCAINYSLVDVSITYEDIKPFLEKGLDEKLAIKKILIDKTEQLLNVFSMMFNKMISEFLNELCNDKTPN